MGDDYINIPEFYQLEFTSGLSKNYPLVGEYEYADVNTKIKRVDNLKTFEYNIDKSKDECRSGNNNFDFVAAFDFNLDEIKKYCKDDAYMRKFSDELKRLNEDVTFTEFLSAEEEAEKTHNTLMYNAKQEGIIEGAEQNKEDIVKNMLNKGSSDEFIIEITGITKKKLEQIKKELK